jgi:phage terminase large subunit-like protein
MALRRNSRLSSAERFGLFAERYCGLQLEPFQRRIVEEVFADRRELLVSMPRGQGKSTLMAAVGLFSLLSTPAPTIYCCAASRDQARLLFDMAKRMVKGHPDLASIRQLRGWCWCRWRAETSA